MVTHLPAHPVESDRASQCQADYFRGELHREVDLLNERVRRCQAKLATNARLGQVDQVRHMQAQLRNCAIERRKLTEMLAELTRRFPDDDQCERIGIPEGDTIRTLGS